MKGNIYLLQDNQTLVEMTEETYIDEDLLQKLLGQYPSLLAGHQINPADPRRWIVIKRTREVKGEEGRPEKWSLDHLFLDQDAVPTMVEVKRITEARSGRRSSRVSKRKVTLLSGDGQAGAAQGSGASLLHGPRDAPPRGICFEPLT